MKEKEYDTDSTMLSSDEEEEKIGEIEKPQLNPALVHHQPAPAQQPMPPINRQESGSSYTDPPDMTWEWGELLADQGPETPQATTTRRYTVPRREVKTPEPAPATINNPAQSPSTTPTSTRTAGRRPRVQKGTYFESPPEKSTSRGRKQARQSKHK